MPKVWPCYNRGNIVTHAKLGGVSGEGLRPSPDPFLLVKVLTGCTTKAGNRQLTTILLVGAADTGRAPIAAALLLRLLGTHGHPWAVESSGVLGHDDAPAEVEARDTMVHMGLDIGAHQARSIDDE